MSTIDIYENIKNPLDNMSLMRNLFTAYLKTRNFDDFNEYINRMSATKNFTLENELVGEEASKKFLMLMFSLWRKNVLNTSLDKVPLKKYDNLNEYLNTKEFLKSIDNVEIVSTNNCEDDGFNWYKKDIDYTYITSYYIDVTQLEEINKEHVLYININSKSALFRVIESFIIQCIKYNLPYNFKYSNDINNDSTLVIYSDTKNLAGYVNILSNICNDNELNITMCPPKLLSGVIDKYIGYESYIYDDLEQFTNLRLQIIYKILDNEIPKLYDCCFRNDICDFKDLTFNDYIFDEILKSKERILDRKQKGIVSYIKLKYIINVLKDTSFKNLKDTTFKIGIKDNIVIERKEIVDLIIYLLNSLFRKYPKYIKRISTKIKNISEDYNIDKYTFCFDLYTINKLSQYELGKDIIQIETTNDAEKTKKISR